MALGTPCVVTRSVGPSEFIIDGENGVMVEPTVSSLIDGIYRLAEDTALQAKLIANGRATLTQGFTPQVVIEKIEKIIDKC
jgi:glycosyltransferase involved in cell wall biosynthesis